jgi:acyl transferase domain-containing protein/acyl carrier protein
VTRPALTAPVAERWLSERLARLAGVRREEIDPLAPFSAYGLGSAQAIALAGELEAWLGRTLEPTLAYEYPCVRSLAAHLAGDVAAPAPLTRRGGVGGSPVGPVERSPVAVVGAACRLPGGVASPEDLWRLLADGRDGARIVPADRWEADRYLDPDPTAPGKAYTQHGGFIDDLAGFDAQLFGLAPAEALRMDPQQRLLLELSWAALEDAGIAPDGLRGARAGVYVGLMDALQYALLQIEREGVELLNDPFFAMGAAASVAAGRIAYVLDLRGPAVPVDTACSSSLVSVHLAVQGLRNHDCDLALVGGASAIVHPNALVQACKMGMLARDGRCKAFDAEADGFLLSEGGGVVVLERLADARAAGHLVLAVIEGTAINQDGASNGLTAPSRGAQAEVIRAALADAGATCDSIDYVEAHGSGTQLGDAIEAGALRDVFSDREAAREPLTIGSVKTNLGHLQSAAGVAGLLKTALALERAEMPRTLHLHRPNPAARLDGEPLAAATEHRLWPRSIRRRRASVSSFGWSGTNAHAVLAAPPTQAPGRPPEQPWQLLMLSAATPAALRQSAARLAEALDRPAAPQLRDVAYTLAVGRARLRLRRALVCRDVEDARRQLAALAGEDVAASPDGAPPPEAAPHHGVAPHHAAASLDGATGAQRAASLRELASRWERGEAIAAEAVCADRHAHRVRLPGYPFQHTRFWPAPGPALGSAPGPAPEPARPAAKRPDLAHWCSIPVWEPRALAAATALPDGPWLVLADRGPGGALARALRDADRLVTVVEPADELSVIAGGACTLDPSQPDQYRALLEALAAAECLPRAVVHAWAAPDCGIECGFAGVLALAQAFERVRPGATYELTVLTSGAQVLNEQETGAPALAALATLPSSIAAEQPNVRLRYVDLPPGEEALTALLAELAAPAAGDVTAWRGGARYERAYRDVGIEASGVEVWRRGGVYLITGGLGGLGLALARHLAQTVAARLVLVGRRRLPPRGGWEAYLARDGEFAADIRAVQELECLGAEVLVLAADVADSDAMRAAVRTARRHFGALHGVVHAAGVPGGGLLQGRTLEQIDVVLRPKVGGTLALEAALREEPVDFIALFSSSSAVLGGFGESDYAFANGFMDAWAAGARGSAQRVVSIAWGAWRRDRWQRRLFAAHPELARRARGYREAHGIADAEGIELLTRVLASGHRNVLVLPQDIATTRQTIAALASPDALLAPAPLRQLFPRPDLRCVYAPPRSDAERRIAAIWSKHLGIAEVGVDDPFFELGGNSLIGLTVLAEIERDLGLALAAGALFERPTVRALARALDGDTDDDRDLSAQLRGQRRRELAAASQRGHA